MTADQPPFLDGALRAIEEVARMHDDEARYLQKQRDIGMANHHRAWAQKIRKEANHILALIVLNDPR